MQGLKESGTCLVILLMLAYSSVTLAQCPVECDCHGNRVNCTGNFSFDTPLPDNANVLFIKFSMGVIRAGTFSLVKQVTFDIGTIERIEKGAFEGMGRGKSESASGGLHFQHVAIGDVQTGAFEGIQGQQARFGIQNAEIINLQPKPFGNSTFGSISIDGVDLHNFQGYLFGNGLWVKQLTIENMYLGTVPSHFFGGSGFKQITVRSSAIGVIGPGAFVGVRNAQITLEALNITTISSEAFDTATHIALVRIVKADIGRIESGIFGRMTGNASESFVQISQTNIGVLKNQAFRGLDTFSEFVFKNNRITCQETGALDNIMSSKVDTKPNDVGEEKANCDSLPGPSKAPTITLPMATIVAFAIATLGAIM